MEKETFRGAMTITFGEVAENHVRMQKIGEMADSGFTVDELRSAKEIFEKEGHKVELILLNEALPSKLVNDASPAAVLVVRKGVEAVLGKSETKHTKDELTGQLVGLPWDSKALMYGRVVDKHARHNLCFGEASQEPNYKAGKGRIVAFDDEKVAALKAIREGLDRFLGNKAENLQAEGNLYFDPKNCGIGWHGDGERKRVVALRLGTSIPLHYHWFLEGKPVGETVKLKLEDGDLYVMSEKASGWDWKKKKVPTLRHAAGSEKFLRLPVDKKRKRT